MSSCIARAVSLRRAGAAVENLAHSAYLAAWWSTVPPQGGIKHLTLGSRDGRRDECLKQEIFYSLKEAQTVIGLWQNTYNRVRPHSSLGYRPPAPVSFPDLACRLPMAATMQ